MDNLIFRLPVNFNSYKIQKKRMDGENGKTAYKEKL